LQVQFQYYLFIWLFIALAFLALLFIALLQWKRKARKRIGDNELVRQLISNFSSRLFLVKFIVLSIAMALGIVAVMNPRMPGKSDSTNRKGIDVAIALDVSKSMLAADFPPNRLERAKQFINKLMNEMPDDRIALILFAGKAYLQMPLTIDHGAAKMFVSSATTDAVPQQGTVISDALDMTETVFNTGERRYKSVVVISDGEDHDEKALDKAKELAEQGVMINTVGIGSTIGAVIIDPVTGEEKKDENGNTVISKLNEAALKELAKETNGIYIHLESSDAAVTTLKEHLSQIETKSFADVSQMQYTSYYYWFAIGMFVLLFAENFIPERKKMIA